MLIKHRGSNPSGVVGSVFTYPFHPFDEDRLGRLPLLVRVQRERLRADHWAGPPAAASAPGLRGVRFVICNFVPRKVDYHPLSIPVPYYSPTSTATRSCSTSTVTTRRARARASAWARSRSTRVVMRTDRRRGLREVGRCPLLRRAGGHGRHLQATRARRGRPRLGRPTLCLVLGAERGRAARRQRPGPTRRPSWSEPPDVLRFLCGPGRPTGPVVGMIGGAWLRHRRPSRTAS